MRRMSRWVALFVFGGLLAGSVGCSYHKTVDERGHGGGGHHDREDVYVHDNDHHHYDH